MAVEFIAHRHHLLSVALALRESHLRRSYAAAAAPATAGAAAGDELPQTLDGLSRQGEIGAFDDGGHVNEETFNLSIRKFLKMVGVNSQREIEQAVDSARAAGRIKGTEAFPAQVTLRVGGLDIDVRFDGEIRLE